MKGVGIDLIEVARIEKSMAHPRFLERWFGEEERKLFCGKNAAERAAANFAAKEAFSKALGTGVRGFSLREVEVLRDEHGAPYLKCTGNAERLVKERRLRFLCSLTHTAAHAQAIVIALSEEE